MMGMCRFCQGPIPMESEICAECERQLEEHVRGCDCQGCEDRQKFARIFETLTGYADAMRKALKK